MDFNEFLELAIEKKVEFKYKGGYYHFISTKSYEENTAGFFIVMFHGKLMFGVLDSWGNSYSVDDTKREYIEFLKKAKIDDINLSEIINNKLYDCNTFRIIPEVIKKDSYDRNINTIAEMLALNYMNLDMSITYNGVGVSIWGNCKKDYEEAEERDYFKFCLTIQQEYITDYKGIIEEYNIDSNHKITTFQGKYGGESETISIEQIEDINLIYDKGFDFTYTTSDSLDKFYNYLYKVKIKGIFLRDILEQGLYDYVEMAI